MRRQGVLALSVPGLIVSLKKTAEWSLPPRIFPCVSIHIFDTSLLGPDPKLIQSWQSFV